MTVSTVTINKATANEDTERRYDTVTLPIQGDVMCANGNMPVMIEYRFRDKPPSTVASDSYG